jgi:hypothetical protein
MFALCSYKRGTRVGRHKLTLEQVLEAGLYYAAGELKWSKLARQYGVSREAVRNAAEGVTFKHLPMPPKRRR